MLFHHKKAVKLDRDDFADLGLTFPVTHPVTSEDFQVNVAYFKRELKRLGDSIAWINDECPAEDLITPFDMLLLACSHLTNEETAKQLTEVLRGILVHVNSLPCRIVRSEEERLFVVDEVQEAALKAAMAIEPLIKQDDLANMICVKQTISTAMNICNTCRHNNAELSSKTSWSDEELLEAGKIAMQLDAQYAKVLKEEEHDDVVV